jgi:glyoxylase-like metal-dependent hydrolase (beta-lactamase superfamily II)
MKRRFLTTMTFLTFSALLLSQQVNYEVYAIRLTPPKQNVPASMFSIDAPIDASISAVFMIWLVRDGSGRNILVDAGFHADLEEAKQLELTDYIRPDSALLRLGVKAADITDIILTHPHWDHIDGIDLFPNAKIWIQKDDYNYFVGNAWQKDGRTWGFNKRDVCKLVEQNLAGKLNFVDGDNHEIISGIKVYTGSRHTYNSQYVLVKSGADKIIIASVNVYSYYNLEQLKSAPEEATFDKVGYVKAMERMKTLASDIKFIIPGHDGLLFSKFPQVAEGVVKIK